MNCTAYLIHIVILLFMKASHQQVHAAQNVFRRTSTKGRDGSELTDGRELKVTEHGSTLDRTSETGGLRIDTESYRGLDKRIQENYQTGFQAGFEAALKMNSQKEMSDDRDSTQQNLRRPSDMISKSSGMGEEQSNVEEKHENVRFHPQAIPSPSVFLSKASNNMNLHSQSSERDGLRSSSDNSGVLVANRGSGQTYSIDAYTDDAIVKAEKGSKAGEHVTFGAVYSRNIPAKRLALRQHGVASEDGSPGEAPDHSASAVGISVKGGSFDGYGIGYVRNANYGTASSSQGHTLRQRPSPQSMYAGGEVPSSSIENIPITRDSVASRKVGFSGDDSLVSNSDRDRLKVFGSAVGYAEGEKVTFGIAVNDKRKQTGITVENGSFAGHASAGAK